MKIYIAGKITGLDDYMKRFKDKQKELEDQGHIIINPVGLNDILGEDFIHDDYMHVCYSLIDLCDGVYLLNNWKDSEGAKKEKTYAVENSKNILFENTF